jgi:hypothetical protein
MSSRRSVAVGFGVAELLRCGITAWFPVGKRRLLTRDFFHDQSAGKALEARGILRKCLIAI